MNLLIKKSNFFGSMCADEISNKEFIGYQATLKWVNNKVYLSFNLKKDLDAVIIIHKIKQFQWITIEDAYFVRKLKQILMHHNLNKKIYLKISTIEMGVIHKIKFEQHAVKITIY